MTLIIIKKQLFVQFHSYHMCLTAANVKCDQYCVYTLTAFRSNSSHFWVKNKSYNNIYKCLNYGKCLLLESVNCQHYNLIPVRNLLEVITHIILQLYRYQTYLTVGNVKFDKYCFYTLTAFKSILTVTPCRIVREQMFHSLTESKTKVIITPTNV